ncbi:uncharacterized protein LOC133297863 [Gastrolobium bilobum]|uniref:uncharacterized protein LOC133297863 n=1 Tax=Gastrolobium bilobum TaxID=150636 RepID=UPI002AB058B8|nr:uncharacterized protein LOC133297863 [Gastrolobium bilobum]
MQQKVVLKLQMDCDKCRNKALKIAAEIQGVTSVSLEGDEKDRVAVTGDNIDMICLANQLKKKFRSVIILSVEEVKKPADKKKEEEKKKEKEKKKEEEKNKGCAVLCLPPCDLCTKCHSPSCKGKCDKYSKCNNLKCDGKCVIICIKCQSPKCHGQCNPCSKCESPKCDGKCVINCFHCHNPKCHGECKPPPPCFVQCPPGCTCHKCYVPYPPCYPYPPYCRVVYDPNPDSCSIM